MAIISDARVNNVPPSLSKDCFLVKKVDRLRGNDETALGCAGFESDAARQSVCLDVFVSSQSCEQIEWDDCVPASELVAEVQSLEGKLGVTRGS